MKTLEDSTKRRSSFLLCSAFYIWMEKDGKNCSDVCGWFVLSNDTINYERSIFILGKSTDQFGLCKHVRHFTDFFFTLVYLSYRGSEEIFSEECVIRHEF